MIAILSTVISILAFRFRRCASLELELIALRHQVSVLRRQHPGRLRLFTVNRLLWVWLFRVWPTVAIGAVEAGSGGPVAAQWLAGLLAVAITPSGTAQDEHRNP